MANIVLLTAAGTGSRTHQFIPKQFISIKDKPIIIYTLEKFQKHPEIDKMVVTCLEGWENCLSSYAQQFGITKLEKIVKGGKTGFESIKNGLDSISEFAAADDIILIHDGNRPCVNHDIISDCIFTAKSKGNAVVAIPTTEVVFKKENENTSLNLLNRDHLLRTQTPQAASYKKVIDLYNKAQKDHLTSSVAFCSLLYEYKEEINFVNGSEKNFKITVKDDIDLFKGLIETGEN